MLWRVSTVALQAHGFRIDAIGQVQGKYRVSTRLTASPSFLDDGVPLQLCRHARRHRLCHGQPRTLSIPYHFLSQTILENDFSPG